MKPTIVSRLKCPVCAASMYEEGNSVRCMGARTHCYDRAKSGYLNLTSPKDGEGDMKDAVRARKAFLAAGYYEPLSNALNVLLSKIDAQSVLDAGCGEGYYTNRMGSDRDVLGVDLSRAGIDSAAKVSKQTDSGAAFAVASLFTLPVGDASFDAVTNLFAPCAEAEFCRVLKENGHLILVGAGEKHLLGLKRILYENQYLNPGRADLPVGMEQVAHERLSYSVRVTGREHIDALFSMTPYYWRTPAEGREHLAACDVLETEVDFDIYLFRKGEKP